MRIAFAIANLFPGGGLQRDCIEIAKLIRKAGHEIVIHTARLNRSIASDNLAVVVLPNTARTNHSRQQRFAADVLAATAGTFDALVGFEKLSGLEPFPASAAASVIASQASSWASPACCSIIARIGAEIALT